MLLPTSQIHESSGVPSVDRGSMGRTEPADAHFELLSGVEAHLVPRCRDLVPIVGWMARQSKALESLYRFTPDDSPLGRVLHSLFYRTEGVEFEPSKKAHRVAKHLSPFAIGALAGFVASYRESSESAVCPERVLDVISKEPGLLKSVRAQKDIHERAKEMAANAVVLFHEGKDQISRLNAELEESRKAFSRNSARRAALVDKAINNSSEELRNRIRAIKKGNDPELAGKDVREAKSEVERDELTKFNKDQEVKRTQALVLRQQLIERVIEGGAQEVWDEYRQLTANIEAHQAEEQSHHRRVNEVRDLATERIKAAWSDSDEQRQFFSTHIKFNRAGRYFDQYIETLVRTYSPEGAIEEDLPSLIKNVYECLRFEGGQLVGVALMHFLTYRISSGEDRVAYLNGFECIHPAGLVSHSLEEFGDSAIRSGCMFAESVEHSAFEVFRAARLESPTPPIASTRFPSVRLDDGSSVCFPDCGETTIRNFLNLMLYNRETQRYEAERLRHAALRVSPALVSFFERNPEVSDTCSQRVHDEWAQLMSGLGFGIEYILPYDAPCAELRPGAANMTRVLNALFGTEDWSQVAGALVEVSASVQSIELSAFDPIGLAEDFQNKISIFVADRVVEWHFLQRHFRMYEKVSVGEESKGDDRIGGAFESLAAQIGAIATLTVLAPALRTRTVERVQGMPFFQSLEASQALYALLSGRLDWTEDVAAVGRAGLRDSRMRAHQPSVEAIKKLLLSIPWFDGHGVVREQIAREIEDGAISEFLELAPLLRSKMLTVGEGSKFQGRDER